MRPSCGFPGRMASSFALLTKERAGSGCALLAATRSTFAALPLSMNGWRMYCRLGRAINRASIRRPTAAKPGKISSLANEGAFAASNSSLCVDNEDIYFATGGADKARVFHSPDSGATWSVAETPIAAGNASSGIFSLDCKAGNVLYAAGGDYRDVSRAFHSAAYFHSAPYMPDGDDAWHLSKQQPGGFRSGIANVYTATVLAVGPSGEDISHDFGVTWQHTDTLNLNAVTILDIYNAWAVGPKGTVARFITTTNMKSASALTGRILSRTRADR